MTRKGLIKAVRRIRYKPGWAVGLHDVDHAPGDSWVVVYLEGLAPDPYRPGQRFLVSGLSHRFHPRTMTVRKLLLLVRRLVWEAERHEADEWIRYRGKRPFDPHRG